MCLQLLAPSQVHVNTDLRSKQAEMCLNSILFPLGHAYLHSVGQATEFLNWAVQECIFKMQVGLKRMILYSNTKRRRNYELNGGIKNTHRMEKQVPLNYWRKLATHRFYHLLPPPQRDILLSTETEEAALNKMKGSDAKNRKGKNINKNLTYQ